MNILLIYAIIEIRHDFHIKKTFIIVFGYSRYIMQWQTKIMTELIMSLYCLHHMKPLCIIATKFGYSRIYENIQHDKG